MPPERQLSPASPKITPPVFIWILITVAILFGAFEIYKLYVLPQTVENDPSNFATELDTSTASTSSISNWKAYTNSTFEYSFSYPPKYSLMESSFNHFGDKDFQSIGVPNKFITWVNIKV